MGNAKSGLHHSLTIPATGVRTLCWMGDDLVDWAAGGVIYHLDGSSTPAGVFYAYRFDAAVAAPSGRYVALYERLGTKALLLDNGRLLRELDRSYYHAHVYEYPIALFALPDGREVVAHCPESYRQLEIEEIASGRRLTARKKARPADFFHSRLAVNPNSTRLLSAGWIWHPVDSVSTYDLKRALADPASLDRLSDSAER